MTKNLAFTQGRAMSEAVMIALTKKDVNRQDAHELLRQLSIESEVKKQPFREVLLGNPFIRDKLTEQEIDTALNPTNYLGTALEQVELAVKRTRNERQARGLS